MRSRHVPSTFVLLIGPSIFGLMAAIVASFAIWAGVSAVILLFLLEYASPCLQLGIKPKSLLRLIVLFIPLGLVMDVVHECGHALWGTLIGGKLAYLKIAFLELYPRLAVTSQFDLGITRIDGLAYGSFGHGLMLLGGSMTTSIISWILGLILMRVTLDRRTKVALKAFGLFGILDLPLYVVLPQIGLRHWLFLGGNNPEPLNGARAMGVPDPLFYLVMLSSSVGLFLSYSESLRTCVRKLAARLGITNLKTAQI